MRSLHQEKRIATVTYSCPSRFKGILVLGQNVRGHSDTSESDVPGGSHIISGNLAASVDSHYLVHEHDRTSGQGAGSD